MKFGVVGSVVVGCVLSGAASAQSPPDTKITTSPPSISYSTRAVLRYSAPQGATFECRLDNETFTACPSDGAKTYDGLTLGEHSFAVKATQGGVADPSPASVAWTVARARLDVIPGYVIPIESSTESVPVGWTLAMTAAITNHLHVVSEGSGDFRTLDIAGREIHLTRYAFLNGLHVVARSRHVDGFLQVLGGVVSSNDNGGTADRFSNHAGLQLGGGGDFNVSGRLAVRFTAGHRFMYLDEGTRGEWRFGTGLVLRFNRDYE